jgi:two-component system sensor histidine kinase UhpB
MSPVNFLESQTMEATRVPEAPGKIPDLPPAARQPLDLPRLVMRRAAWVAGLGVLLLLVLGLARMRDDVDDELAGARSLAELAGQLGSLEHLDDSQALRALQAWQRGAALRHLSVQVADAQGRVVLADGGAQTMNRPMRWLADAGTWLFTPTPPFSVSWALARPAGAAWSVALTAAPDSERMEALSSLLEGAAWMALVAGAMLAAMHWNTRRAFAPMSGLLQAIGQLQTSDGQATVHLPRLPVAELETIAAALRRLDAAWVGAQRARRQLARQVLSLQEDERARLARDLHDEFGQQLTALRVNATWLARRSAGQDELARVAKDMSDQCEHIQHDIRELLARLRPMAQADDSLAPFGEGLQALVAGWQRSPAGATTWSLQLDLHNAQGVALGWAQAVAAGSMPRETALALYRISQEALTNVARHARATEATLSLALRLPPVPGGPMHWRWSVADNGVGLLDPAAAMARGNGLAGIRERLWVLGADLRIDVPDGGGPGCRLASEGAT